MEFVVPSENLDRTVVIEVSRDLVQAAPTMIPALLATVASFRSLLCSRASLQAEVLALRHQLLVLERQHRGRRVALRASDRFLWTFLSRLWPGWRRALVLVQPETVLRWLWVLNIHPHRVRMNTEFRGRLCPSTMSPPCSRFQ